jgi:hypothetical protein
MEEDKDMNKNNIETIEVKKNEAADVLNMIFHETLITVTLWLIVVYMVMGSVYGIFNAETGTTILKVIDLGVLILLSMYFIFGYYSFSGEERKSFFTTMAKEFKNYFNDASNILNVSLLMVVIYGLAYTQSTPEGIESMITFSGIKMPSTMGYAMNLGSLLVILLIISAFFNSILKIPLLDILYENVASLFEKKSKEILNEVEEEVSKEEVFNISNNLYTYEEAPFVCQAVGGRLASYDEVEEAYNNGAEWCNYGWSQNQLALFPTQKETWNKIQNSAGSDCDKDASMKNACGRPGVNGGYIGNPNVKYGVNCYGVKPKAKDHEINRFNANKDKVLPKSRSQMLAERKMSFWKENADKLLSISSYNRDDWSRY